MNCKLLFIFLLLIPLIECICLQVPLSRSQRDQAEVVLHDFKMDDRKNMSTLFKYQINQDNYDNNLIITKSTFSSIQTMKDVSSLNYSLSLLNYIESNKISKETLNLVLKELPKSKMPVRNFYISIIVFNTLFGNTKNLDETIYNKINTHVSNFFKTLNTLNVNNPQDLIYVYYNFIISQLFVNNIANQFNQLINLPDSSLKIILLSKWMKAFRFELFHPKFGQGLITNKLTKFDYNKLFINLNNNLYNNKLYIDKLTTFTHQLIKYGKLSQNSQQKLVDIVSKLEDSNRLKGKVYHSLSDYTKFDCNLFKMKNDNYSGCRAFLFYTEPYENCNKLLVKYSSSKLIQINICGKLSYTHSSNLDKFIIDLITKWFDTYLVPDIEVPEITLYVLTDNHYFDTNFKNYLINDTVAFIYDPSVELVSNSITHLLFNVFFHKHLYSKNLLSALQTIFVNNFICPNLRCKTTNIFKQFSFESLKSSNLNSLCILQSFDYTNKNKDISFLALTYINKNDLYNIQQNLDNPINLKQILSYYCKTSNYRQLFIDYVLHQQQTCYTQIDTIALDNCLKSNIFL